jgi:hypothetical protein
MDREEISGRLRLIAEAYLEYERENVVQLLTEVMLDLKRIAAALEGIERELDK